MKKQVLFVGAAVLLLALALTVTVPRPAQAGSLDFPDVPDTGPMREAIQALANSGVISGYADGRFRPFASVTRVQAAKMLVAWRQPVFEASADATPSSADTSPFTDLTSAQCASVSAAVLKGWLSGYSDRTFRPGNPLTREQMATVIVRSLGLDAAARALTIRESGLSSRGRTTPALESGSVREKAPQKRGFFSHGTFRAPLSPSWRRGEPTDRDDGQ